MEVRFDVRHLPSISGSESTVSVVVYCRASEYMYRVCGNGAEYDALKDADDEVLIYSAEARHFEKQPMFGSEGHKFYIDDVFVEWGTLGWISMNELYMLGMLHRDPFEDEIFC